MHDEDHQLLRQYTQGSRQALDALVRRHLNLVHSAACRQTRDPHLAEDITQAVFLILAKKAPSISQGTAVGGWLLTVTRRTTVNAMKKQRTFRTQDLSHAKPEGVPDPTITTAHWNDIAPILDHAMDHLPTQDRDAIVLRILENQSLSSVGTALGISEAAAGKRVARALEKLRKLLSRKGVNTPIIILTAVLASEAIRPAPAHALTTALAAASGTPAPAASALAKTTLVHLYLTANSKLALTAVALIIFLFLLGTLVAWWPSPKPRGVTVAAAVTNGSTPQTRGLPPSTWTTLDSFQLDPSHGSRVLALATDPQGNLHAAGYAIDAAGTSHAIIRQQSASTRSWNTIFDTTVVQKFTGITFDARGRLIAAGDGTPASAFSAAIFMRDANGSFAVVDPPANISYRGDAITVDARGNVFACGISEIVRENNLTTYVWTVRRRTPDSTQFTTVDYYQPDAGYNGARSIAAIGDSIFVVGEARVLGDENGRWTVRRSSDSGTTWTTVDSFHYNSSAKLDAPSAAQGIASDGKGKIYVVGMGTPDNIENSLGPALRGSAHWLVRQSVIGNTDTWTTADDVAFSTQPWTNELARADRVAVDPAGRLYVFGSYNASTGSPAQEPAHYLIRTNATGTWTTFEDSTTTMNTAVLIDSHASLYVAGADFPSPKMPGAWLVRSRSLESLTTKNPPLNQ